jgi:glycosyltransferase involved in cell wall biosynthesis
LAAIVVIGRNEGERLRRCLAAALRQSSAVVYVDSGSNDGSPMLARSLGVDVVELDSTAPYTAARARNAGFQFLLGRMAVDAVQPAVGAVQPAVGAVQPAVGAVQFVDGDCELAEGWLQIAEAELARRPELAAVCGRRRERFPDASIFNRLCDLEWDTPSGDVASFGGDVLVRVAAFRMAGGFRPELIAGEEPELSVRLRRKGWKIVRLAAEMTLHDSNMVRFGQWWRRTLRSGHAYAEGAWLHGLEAEHHWLRKSLSIWFWGVAWPLLAAWVAWVWSLGALAMLAAYPALLLKIYFRMRRIGRGRRDALLYSAFCVLGKFPQALGQIRYHAGKLARRRSGLIEYKST